jgi:hypothetical protein
MLHPSVKKRAGVPAVAIDSTSPSSATTTGSTTIMEIRPAKITRCNVQENELFDLSLIKDDNNDE